MKFTLSLLSLVILATPAYAKELYVDGTNGNDSTTYEANGPSSPWRTIGRAAWGSTNRNAPNASQAARAGDTVRIAAGTYSTAGTGGRFNVAYNPVNSGTSGNPIQFVAEGLVTLQLSSGTGPVIGSAGKNYIVWDGFFIDETNARPVSDTGPVTVSGSTGVVIRGLHIRGIQVGWEDNHNGIRVEAANGTVIQNNLIYGIASMRGRGQNDAAVMLYDSNDTVIENNEFHSTGVGVFVKGQHDGQTQRRTIIRRNLIYGMSTQGLTLGPAARDGRTYQNIIRNCASEYTPAVKLYDFGAGEGREPINEIIANNTIYACKGFDVIDVGVGNIIANNIIDVAGGRSPIESVRADLSSIQINRQVYHGIPGGAVARLDADGRGANYSLSSWRSTFGHDVNGITQNPGFVNVGAGDFRLSASSPARTVGLDILDLNGNGSTSDVIPAGAYVVGNETIGRFNAGSVGLPTAPSGLRIVPPQ